MVAQPTVQKAEGIILIDPGHGGEDGGASADGVLEKNINLDIALKLYDLLQVCGFSVRMTRYSDVSIHADDTTGIRQKKVSDMRNRLAMYEKANLVISIHQNHFSAAKYSGTQVFYAGAQLESAVLAQAIQSEVVRQLQPQNTRQIKKATDGIYLLFHTTRPAVLVECGFLSNPTERDRLNNTEYRQRFSFAVMSGIWKYLTEE